MKLNNHIKIPKKRIGVLMVNLEHQKNRFYKYVEIFTRVSSDRRIIELTKLFGI